MGFTTSSKRRRRRGSTCRYYRRIGRRAGAIVVESVCVWRGSRGCRGEGFFCAGRRSLRLRPRLRVARSWPLEKTGQTPPVNKRNAEKSGVVLKISKRRARSAPFDILCIRIRHNAKLRLRTKNNEVAHGEHNTSRVSLERLHIALMHYCIMPYAFIASLLRHLPALVANERCKCRQRRITRDRSRDSLVTHQLLVTQHPFKLVSGAKPSRPLRRVSEAGRIFAPRGLTRLRRDNHHTFLLGRQQTTYGTRRGLRDAHEEGLRHALSVHCYCCLCGWW